MCINKKRFSYYNMVMDLQYLVPIHIWLRIDVWPFVIYQLFLFYYHFVLLIQKNYYGAIYLIFAWIGIFSQLLIYLSTHWNPKIDAFIGYRKSTLKKASHILVRTRSSKPTSRSQIVLLNRFPTSFFYC